MNLDATTAVEPSEPACPAAPRWWRFAIGGTSRAGALIVARARSNDWEEAARFAASSAPAAVLLAGGEPTARADLPQLVALFADAGARVGIVSDGESLQSAAAVRALASLGVSLVRVTFHSSRSDAGDWITGSAGSVKRALRAIQAVREAGVELEVECVVTRPVLPHLHETATLVSRLLPSRIVLRAAGFDDVRAEDAVMLIPRGALAGPYLRLATAECDRLGIEVAIAGFAPCVTGIENERFVVEEEWNRGTLTERCSRCDPARCAGIDRRYLELFGWTELAGPLTAAEATEAVEARATGAPPPPPARGGRPAATRLAFAKRQAERSSLCGDPQLGMESLQPPDSILVRIDAPTPVHCAACASPAAVSPDETRAVRVRLSRAAQEGARRIRLASTGLFRHPAAADLLRESVRLSMPEVEIATELSGLAAIGDGEIAKLRGITRVDMALFGPDAASHDAHIGIRGAFDCAMAQLERIAELTGAITGSYAVLHDAAAVPAYASRWANGDLPGEPQFRLSPAGASLAALAETARTLNDERSRLAIERLLPSCLGGLTVNGASEWFWHERLHLEPRRSGSDRFGEFTPCRACGDSSPFGSKCRGIAAGWQLQRPEEGAR